MCNDFLTRFFGRSGLHLANVISNYLLPKYITGVVRLRPWIYRNIGGLEIGRNVRMYGGTYILGNKLFLRDNVFVGANCLFACSDSTAIVIESNCDISYGVTFACGSHEIGSSDHRAGQGTRKVIKVGTGTWIGCNAVILGGVTIGEGSVVGASSLVNKDVPGNVVIGGVPARVLRNLGD